MSDSSNSPRRARPLSPHLGIYKPQITSLMSISNRFAGAASMVGIYTLAIWVSALLISPELFTTITDLFKTPVGMIALFGWSVTATYYLFHGLRHLMWDTGYGFDISTLRKTGYAALLLTAITVYSLWAYAFGCGCISGFFNMITGQ